MLKQEPLKAAINPKEASNAELESARRTVSELIDLTCQDLGLQIPKEQYPKVVFSEQWAASYNPGTNTLGLSDSFRRSGMALSEEIFHCLRAQLRPAEQEAGISLEEKTVGRSLKERAVSEFFGRLGEYIMPEAVKGSPHAELFTEPLRDWGDPKKVFSLRQSLEDTHNKALAREKELKAAAETDQTFFEQYGKLLTGFDSHLEKWKLGEISGTDFFAAVKKDSEPLFLATHEKRNSFNAEGHSNLLGTINDIQRNQKILKDIEELRSGTPEDAKDAGEYEGEMRETIGRMIKGAFLSRDIFIQTVEGNAAVLTLEETTRRVELRTRIRSHVAHHAGYVAAEHLFGEAKPPSHNELTALFKAPDSEIVQKCLNSESMKRWKKESGWKEFMEAASRATGDSEFLALV